MKKKSFQVRVIQGPLQKIASGVALSVAIIASVACNPPPPPPPCGDGETLGDRNFNECDDGNLLGGDGCDELCAIEPGFECSDPQLGGASTCAPIECGNGLRFIEGFAVNVNEECDDGELNSDTTPNACRTDCTRPSCSDGVADDLFGESCDDGANNSDTAPDGCRTDCALSSCGDNVIDTDEECDDGNNTPDDGCSPVCVADFCGDGINNNSNTEVCDDGNTSDGDGCDSSCVIELCGDGVTNNNPDPNNPTEQCDDGANNSDATPNAYRVGCAVPSCGDGIIDNLFGEQCDDGNTDDTDGCKSNCTL